MHCILRFYITSGYAPKILYGHLRGREGPFIFNFSFLILERNIFFRDKLHLSSGYWDTLLHQTDTHVTDRHPDTFFKRLLVQLQLLFRKKFSVYICSFKMIIAYYCCASFHHNSSFTIKIDTMHIIKFSLNFQG